LLNVVEGGVIDHRNVLAAQIAIVGPSRFGHLFYQSPMRFFCAREDLLLSFSWYNNERITSIGLFAEYRPIQ
jgi:hypothetical protein